MLKKLGKVAKGVLRTKAKLLTGNVVGAAKSAVGVAKDTIELVSSTRSSKSNKSARSNNGPKTNTQINLETWGIQQGNRQAVDSPKNAAYVAQQEFALHTRLAKMHPEARTALLGGGPQVLLAGMAPSNEPAGRCGFDTVHSPPTGPRELPGQPPVAVIPTQPGTGDASMNPTDGASLLRMLETQPERFRSAWEGLSESDRQLAMMNLQRQLQAISQLSTMITNMLQSQHSAAMAVARNLAV